MLIFKYHKKIRDMKKTQFIPGAVEAMAEYAVAQYGHLLCDFDTFQVDDEALDAAIEELVPVQIRVAANDANGCASFGCRPLLESGMLDEVLLAHIIMRLDAIEKWVNKGNEFTIWCEFKTKKLKNGFESGRVKVICE
jgi:hypothetical protein